MPYDANIVHVVKKCYIIKIDSRDFRGRFLCFLDGLMASCLSLVVLLLCKRTTFTVQMEYSCNVNGVQLECESGPFAEK